jgi:hypothetical protein
VATRDFEFSFRLSRSGWERLSHIVLLGGLLVALTLRILWRVPARMRHLRQLINEENRAHGAKLSPKFWSRIRQYVVVMCVIEALLAQLTGKRFDTRQQRVVTLLAGLVPLFDDLSDAHAYSIDEIRALCERQPQRPEVLAERICLRLFAEGEFTWSPAWAAAAHAQLAHVANLSTNTATPHELAEQAAAKGGDSVLLGLHLIGTPAEVAVLLPAARQLGAFVQLLDDVFDLWQDREANIATFVTATDAVATSTHIFVENAQKLMATLAQLPYHRSRIRSTQVLCVPFVGLGRIALRQVHELQARSGGNYNVQAYTRQELVCDMARWPNRLRWTWAVLRML